VGDEGGGRWVPFSFFVSTFLFLRLDTSYFLFHPDLKVLTLLVAADAEKSDKAEPEGVDVDVQETPARRRARVRANVGTYAGLLQRACPAGVYEYVLDDAGRVVPGNSEVRFFFLF
jgi:hypothetical protein